MLDSSNIILMIIIAILFVILVFNNGKKKGVSPTITENKQKEKFIPQNPKYKYKYAGNNKSDEESLIDDVNSVISGKSHRSGNGSMDNNWDNSYDPAIVTNTPLNPNFLTMQFHNDYRDVITAFNNIVPEKKQRFNLPNIPLVYSQPEAVEVKNLISDFMNVVNENVKTQVPATRKVNSGWDEAVPDPNVESGWTKTQKALGLAPSLWDDPAGKSFLKIVKITHVQKYETDDEIKYVIDIVIQKQNVDDQLVIKVSFVQDKRPLNDENNFFITKNVEMKVIIEDLFVEGVLSKDGNDARLQFDNQPEKFYDYNALEYNNMTDPKYIQKILTQKYKTRTEEMEQRNAMLDEEGRGFHRNIPNIYDFSNIKGTRTIYDDMNTTKEFI